MNPKTMCRTINTYTTGKFCNKSKYTFEEKLISIQ